MRLCSIHAHNIFHIRRSDALPPREEDFEARLRSSQEVFCGFLSRPLGIEGDLDAVGQVNVDVCSSQDNPPNILPNPCILKDAAGPSAPSSTSRWGEHTDQAETRKHAQSTVDQMSTSHRTFKAWQKDRLGCDKDITDLTLQELVVRLTKFASEARQGNGSLYKRTSLMTIFHAIQRILTTDYEMKVSQGGSEVVM